MKTLITGLVTATLLTASLTAFAEGGGDNVAAHMDAARQRSIEHLRQVVKARAADHIQAGQQAQLKVDPAQDQG
ncbi:co-regulatory protein PtrA N-terminal domain-containing protein [Pseudomonas sp. HS6-2]|uniref:co-regulatory protein PtrA N-terminal domain-containing protein n=1 Tax=Pseudomonas sp. HS6-2 TaxID=3410986 RepID=UPI003BD31B23